MDQNRALFLDRDGVLNALVQGESGLRSPWCWKEVNIYSELEGLLPLKRSGYLFILITNQPDIERGKVEETFVTELHWELKRKFSLDALYVCRFASEDHPWKKPNPGMFLQAAEDFSIDLSRSFHLGDTYRDTEGAKQAGCRSVLWSRSYNQNVNADFRVASVTEVLEILT